MGYIKVFFICNKDDLAITKAYFFFKTYKIKINSQQVSMKFYKKFQFITNKSFLQ